MNLAQEAIEIFQDDNRHLELETLPPACFLQWDNDTAGQERNNATDCSH